MKCKRCGKKFKPKYEDINIYESTSCVYTYLKCDYCGDVNVIEEYKDFKKRLQERQTEFRFKNTKLNFFGWLKYIVRKEIYNYRCFDKILIKHGVCIECKRKKATSDLVVCNTCYNLEYYCLIEQYFKYGLIKNTL